MSTASKKEQVELLLFMAYLCRDLHRNKNLAIYTQYPWKLINTHKSKGVESYMLETIKGKVLVIAGSNEPRDWLRNFSFVKRSGIHLGFWMGAELINNAVDLKGVNFIVGHSQGGAIAQILGNMIDVVSITFGAPMVYEEGEIDREIYSMRVVNCNDIVTKAPPVGYRHYGKLFYLSYNGELLDKISPLDRIRATLKAWSKRQWFNGFYDHDINKYIEKLERIKDNLNNK